MFTKPAATIVLRSAHTGLLVCIAVLALAACQPIQRPETTSTGSVTIVQAAQVAEAPRFSEGYDWYVDPIALRAATIPKSPAVSGRALTPADFSEGYDWYVDPVALRAATISPRGSAVPQKYRYQSSYEPYVSGLLPNGR